MPKEQSAIICNKCGNTRTFKSDLSATSFRNRPCFNPKCDAGGDFRKDAFRAPSSSLRTSGSVTSQKTTRKSSGKPKRK